MFWCSTLTLAETTPFHTHDVFELLFCQGGSGLLFLEQQGIELFRHRSVLVPPRTRHRFALRPQESVGLKVVCLTREDIALHLSATQTAMLSQCTGGGATYTDHPGESPLWSLAETLPDGLGQQDRRELMVAWSTIALLLASHLRSQHAPDAIRETRHRETIRQVCAWLDGNLEQTEDLDGIASRFGLSRSLLTREFRHHTGVSVLDYLSTRRLQKAGRLLTSEGRSILEASLESGFPSLPHFYRRFKALYGVTPSEFQRQFAPRGL